MRNIRLEVSCIHGMKSMKSRQWNKPKDANPGRKGSTDFLVRVMFRKNTTWQGEVHWLGSDKKRSFRSSLELMLLMQEAMDEIETPRTNYNFRTWEAETSTEEQELSDEYLVGISGSNK